MGHDTTRVREFLESLAGYPLQSHHDPLSFDFVLVDGEERSDRILAFFVLHNLTFTVPKQAESVGLRSCRIVFEDADMAMLFKLSFKSNG